MGLRSSTQAYPLITCFHQAMKIANFNQQENYEKAVIMSEKIKIYLKKIIPSILMPFSHTSPYIISFILPGISSDIILRHLEMRGIYISSTSACSSRISGTNASLSAMNISSCYHKNFLRISLGANSTHEEVENLLKEFLSVWESVKHIQKR